jgi:hypothetical protein
MRSIEEIEADIKRLANERDEIKAEMKKEITEAATAIRAEWEPAIAAKKELLAPLHAEYKLALSAKANHPLEGKIVESEELRRDQSYFYGKDKNVKIRGIVTVIRDFADMPQRKQNTRYHPNFEIGDVIIQRINAKGEKLKSWHWMGVDDALPKGWTLVEKEDAA